MQHSIRKKRYEQYQDMVARLYPEFMSVEQPKHSMGALTRTVTFQVTDACNLACTYCYQINKSTRRMSIETAKKMVDLLLSGDKGFDTYVNPEFSPAIIIEFIGGEPFLEIELIDEISTYFFREAIRLEHPWAERFSISICSNGVLYNTPKVQKFLNKFKDHISFSITIDGNKELHDSCRIFPDGRPSYEIAVAGAKDWMSKGYYMGSKITIAPGNINYLYDAIIHIIEELGYDDINCNCVYEEGWTQEHSTILYYQLKKIADYLLEHDLDLCIYISIFEENFFKPKAIGDDTNWCFRAGTMVSTADGYKAIEDILPCDEIYTQGNELHGIEKLTCHEATDGYVIKASGMFDTFTTSSHPYLCKKKVCIISESTLYDKPTWISVKYIEKGDRIALSIRSFGNNSISHDLAYVVGRYIGTGYKCNNHRISIQLDDIPEVICILDKLNINYNILEFSTHYDISILSKSKNEELNKLFDLCGESDSEKYLPSNIYEWSSISAMRLLDGIVDSVGKICKGYDLTIISVYNARLATEILELIRSLGFFPTCEFDKYKGVYTISYDRSTNETVFEYDDVNHVIWTTVNSVKETDENYMVYNMTVKENHSFIANGAIVHNCGGTGSMLSCDPDGYLFPCIRYMESSLGSDQPPYRIGDVDTGIGQTELYANRIKCLNCINRRSQSTDECYYCPIAEGCSWCSGYNYQIFGTPDKRATYICEMHKARALANAYLWAKMYTKHAPTEKYHMFVPEEWALKIIPKEEWDMLLSLPNLKHVTDQKEIEKFHNMKKDEGVI